MTLRLRYENGLFIPLEAVEGIQDGQEIVVLDWKPAARKAELRDMLDRSRGAWSGPEFDGIEEFLAEARRQWDEEWQQRLNSL